MNPLGFLRVADTIVNYQGALFAGATSPLSLSSSREASRGRSLEAEHHFASLPSHRISQRAGGRYVLVADVSRFYESVYTHSIAWALHTKSWAKRNRHAVCAGNDLDRAIQFGQDGQTAGIPIGPDSSLLAGEIIASAVDRVLLEIRPNVRGYRHVDDYQFVCTSLAEVDEVHAALVTALAEYELRQNDAKFEIIELPSPGEEKWVASLSVQRRLIRLSAAGQATDLAAYFDTAFELAGANPRASVLNYALSSLSGLPIAPSNWDRLQALLSQSLTGEPATAPFVLRLLVEGRLGGLPPDPALWGRTVHETIASHSRRRNHSEIAWSVWYALVLNLELCDAALRYLEGVENSVVALLVLDASARGLLPRAPATGAWMPSMTGDGLYDSQWLLSYEANVKTWLPSEGGGDHVAMDAVFGALKADGVSFYNSNWYLAHDPAGLTKGNSSLYP